MLRDRIMCYLQGGALVWSLSQCPSSSLSSSLLPSFFSTFIPFLFLSYSLCSLLPLVFISFLFFPSRFSYHLFVTSQELFPFEDDHLLNIQPRHSMSDSLPTPPTPMVLSELTIWLGLDYFINSLYSGYCDELGKWKRTETRLVRIHIKILLDPRRNPYSLVKLEDHKT